MGSEITVAPRPTFNSTFQCDTEYKEARKKEGRLADWVCYTGLVANQFFHVNQNAYVVHKTGVISFQQCRFNPTKKDIAKNLGAIISVILLTATIALWVLLIAKISFHLQIKDRLGANPSIVMETEKKASIAKKPPEIRDLSARERASAVELFGEEL